MMAVDNPPAGVAVLFVFSAAIISAASADPNINWPSHAGVSTGIAGSGRNARGQERVIVRRLVVRIGDEGRVDGSLWWSRFGWRRPEGRGSRARILRRYSRSAAVASW